ncbi:Endonuclease-reverse transcriptase [Schistosoma japonicum]|uniref:Endonuclease-reverse transcriptase n=1 Tax=Schistosoma japonicum TaxID=6182 RepID=A0A4Z2DY14_SCHJA|nr:Endonuclease-reverse transcriptase [Schistosoma japonicum]
MTTVYELNAKRSIDRSPVSSIQLCHQQSFQAVSSCCSSSQCLRPTLDAVCSLDSLFSVVQQDSKLVLVLSFSLMISAIWFVLS